MKIFKFLDKSTAPKAPTTETKVETQTVNAGKSGIAISSGIFSDEYVSELKGVGAATIYNKMIRMEPQIEKILSAICNPIESALWSVQSASTDPIDEKAASIIRQILFNDLPKTWREKLSEILTFVPHGHAVFEITHVNKQSADLGSYTGLNDIAFRAQSSLIYWHLNAETGKLETVEQQMAGDVPINNVKMDARYLLIFYNRQLGDDNGKALLRTCYGPWKRKQMLQKIQAIGSEKFAIPTPLLEVPTGVKDTSVEYKNAIIALQNFTSSESSYLITPQGWKLTLFGNQFDPSKMEASKKYEDESMAGAILASFLEFNTGGNSGSNAANGNGASFFLVGLQRYADTIAEKFNKTLIPALCQMNIPNLKAYPKLVCSGISDTAGENLMKILTGYSNARLITPDEPLEVHIREQLKLPKKEIVEETETPTTPTETPIEAKPKKADTALPPEEVTLSLSLEGIKRKGDKVRRDMASASEKLAATIKERTRFIAEKYIADIMRNYKNATEAQKINAVQNATIGGDAQLRKALKTSLARTASDALDQVRSENPPVKNVKLTEKAIPSTIKLDEFSKLPKHIQYLLSIQADQYTQKVTSDLQNRVAFQFLSSQSVDADPALIQQALEGAAAKVTDSGLINNAANNLVAQTVNDTRGAFFFDPEVLSEIESFTYTNDDPQSEICQRLAGTTWAANDAEALRYSPPNHQNCQSILVANMKTSTGNPDITGLPSLSKAAIDSATL